MMKCCVSSLEKISNVCCVNEFVWRLVSARVMRVLTLQRNDVMIRTYTMCNCICLREDMNFFEHVLCILCLFILINDTCCSLVQYEVFAVVLLKFARFN